MFHAPLSLKLLNRASHNLKTCARSGSLDRERFEQGL